MTSNELKHKAKLQEWALTVQECRSSGKPVKQWCIENKIKVTTYYRWEREILGTAGKNRNQPSRSGENARSFLSGFKGYLHTDGYAGYHNFSDDITVVGCLAHARRRFDEAVKFNNSLYLPYYLRQVFLYAFRFDAYRYFYSPLDLTLTDIFILL